MDTKRTDCPCPAGTCANMTSDKFRCKATVPAVMPAQACEHGCIDIDNSPTVMTDADRVQYVHDLARAMVRIADDYGCTVSVQPTGKGCHINVQPKGGV